MMKKAGITSTRRRFLKSLAVAGGLTSQSLAAAAPSQTTESGELTLGHSASRPPFKYPRTFSGDQLATVAFPLGGVGAGSVSLGGRGQLRDWEIFNRAHKGNSPEYAFASVWTQGANGKTVARVLEARLAPPYQGESGLGSANAPGLSRLEAALFTGEYPIATVTFRDPEIPVAVSLEAFSPFIPLDAADSGLPAAILRYRVRNRSKSKVAVSIAFSLENPVGVDDDRSREEIEKRTNEYRQGSSLEGLLMSNPGLAADDPLAGSLALCLLNAESGKVTVLRGWPKVKWWASPQLFWDDFTSDGEVGPESSQTRPTGTLCLKQVITAGAEAHYTFLLSWHFPNRTPQWCGWQAPKGDEKTIIGNYYCTRFADAWQVAEYVASRLTELEARTRRFVQAMRDSTLPDAVKDAAMSNLSTLVTPTCFRTADGEFHGFEGTFDRRGCCMGNCTHVWNYETATQFLFPSLARSLRQASFGFSMDEQGAIHFRQLLPAGKQRWGYAAADGQMGQIVKAYLDWRLSGDRQWLQSHWPEFKRALEFAWIPGGWDADRDGVMEGVQHNTYDVEFFGPNPQCGIYYLAALRACAEMAREVGDRASAEEYQKLFAQGSRWIDQNLFNGEFYVQRVRPVRRDQVARVTVGNMGSDAFESPEFQLGEGCLVDQLVGQYLADVAGLGDLLDPRNIRKTLQSIYKYNSRSELYHHDCVQRTYALNDEAALVICDYGRARRPEVPFPYFAEVWTGFEYSTAALMLSRGMVSEGVECIENARRRHDGQRRNPWDEAECGHHYARAMAAWSAVVLLGGFEYRAASETLKVAPRIRPGRFSSFWSTASGWGSFSYAARPKQTRVSVSVTYGALSLRSIELGGRLRGAQTSSVVRFAGKVLNHELQPSEAKVVFSFSESITLREGDLVELLLV